MPSHREQEFGQGQLSATQERGATILELPLLPPTSEDVFLDGAPLPPPELQDTDNPIHQAFGEVRVGSKETRTYWKGYFPENRIEGLGFIVPGFGGFLKSSEALGKSLAKRGLATILYDPIRVSETVCEDFTDPQKIHVMTIEEIYRDLPKNRDIRNKVPNGRSAVKDRLVMYPHSMGGLSAPKFALEHPDEVETLVLLETVVKGSEVIKRIGEAVLKGHFIGELEHELLPYLRSDEIKLTPKNLLRAARYFGFGNPRHTRISKPLGEAISCMTSDMRPYLQEIKEGQDTDIIYVDAEHDVLVRPGKDIEKYVHKLIYLLRCGHLSTQYKSALVAKTTLDAREELKTAA